MHVQTIHQALKKLDIDNDDHWTSDHAPRLDVLEPQLPGITREMLRQAAPLFNRLKPELPDLEAERALAEETMREAQDAERVAADAKQRAEAARATVTKLTSEIGGTHKLTHQNRRWLDSQFEADRARAAHQRDIDEAVKKAGGVNMIGAHPVEKNMAAKIRADRKRDIVIDTKKKVG